MPRSARILNEKQVYHIMLRGNNKENVFKEDEDKARIIQILREKKQYGEYFLYAYCVMDNHIHLLLKEGRDSLGRLMKRIGVSYAQYYNKKYKRVGHVFQDRYKSENIDSDTYLFTAIRYIHQNPAKAKIAKVEEYKWSSFADYLSMTNIMVETVEIIEMFSNDRHKGLQAFIYFNYEDEKGKFIDTNEEQELADDKVREYIAQYIQKRKISLEDLRQRAYKEDRDELIRLLLRETGQSKRSIAYTLGLNREMVRTANLSPEPSP